MAVLEGVQRGAGLVLRQGDKEVIRDMSKDVSRARRNQWKYFHNFLVANRISYQDYLLSDHWKDVRRRFWASKLHNGSCFVCSSKDKLQVHHKSYKRIGKEKMGDLILLCGKCHKETHDFDRGRTEGILWGSAKRLKKNKLLSSVQTSR